MKIVVLTGPTASGKTDLSLRLAKKFHAEIISADSRQVYRGLDIGSGKVPISPAIRRAAAKSSIPSKDGIQYQGVRHHLIDVANPKRSFSVAHYKKLAEETIKNIWKRGKIPIVVGGTGFYIEALITNSALPEVKPNFKLRQKLEKLSASVLFTKLRRLDPRRARNIDRHNKHRLIRALEIIAVLGKVPPLRPLSPFLPLHPLILGLKLPDSKLRRLINQRVDRRIGGIIKEIKTLRRLNSARGDPSGSRTGRRHGLSWERLVSFGLEYRYISWYIMGKLSRKEAVEKLKTASWHFAKRQYTYLKRLPVVWVSNQKQAENKIKKFLEE